MRLVRILPVLAPLALLCACGGGGGETEAGTDTTATPTEANQAGAPTQTAPASETATEATTIPTLKPMTDSPSETTAAPVSPPSAFAQCRSCHSTEPGKNGMGPSLAGIVGSKAGGVPGYNFSGPLKASGIIWTRENLDKWLQGPMKMVPGTRMVIGLPNPEARKSVIDYLETIK